MKEKLKVKLRNLRKIGKFHQSTRKILNKRELNYGFFFFTEIFTILVEFYNFSQSAAIYLTHLLTKKHGKTLSQKKILNLFKFESQ